ATLETVGGWLYKDPWAARDAYIDVLVAPVASSDCGDRGARNVQGGAAQIAGGDMRDRFLQAHASHALGREERVRALSLMEMARHAMLMYTSCGWFFDDLSGIETVQCMQYAARVAELIHAVRGISVEPELVDRLSVARSNLPDEGDGRRVW